MEHIFSSDLDFFLFFDFLSCVFRSESVLELSIMPKDEDVLQLVSEILFG